MELLWINTGRPDLEIRQLTGDDVKPLYQAIKRNRDTLDQSFYIGRKTLRSERTVRKSITNPINPSKVQFGIWKDAIFAGLVNATPGERGIEIGFWLDEQFTGKGIASYATRALCQYLKGDGARTIYAQVSAENEASKHVLENAYFFQSSADPKDPPILEYTYLDPIY